MTFNPSRRSLLAALGATPLVLSAKGAFAAGFPDKAVNLVVWSGAGGALDTYGRQLAELLTKEAGWTVSVQNRPGGSGAVGVSTVLAQKPDGYNILVCTGTLTFGIAQGLIPFKLEDLRYVRAMQAEPSSVAVRADSPLKTLDDFVASMRENPNKLRVGGHAPAGFHQFILYQLGKIGKFESGWIPHDASGKVPLSLLGGHMDVAIMTPSSGLSQVESGDIRLLGISTEERSPFFPNVPTFKEQGYDIVDSVWRGIAVHGKTPDDVMGKIQEAIDKVEASQDWLEFQKREKQENINLGEQAYTQLVQRQLATQGEFLKSVGLIQ
ncbi:Bug family tripartite tricarboxylate transporter substrate binding protein [Microvirga sp. M2]|uniref:Bug family tripartite tricarboxylate transporter substrate binding protein n=1 Tax=Microvirga sp. M2 TaxID=3073270 RepID=UPI0039C34F30